MSRNRKSPMPSIVIFALALLMFVAAVGIGVSMLKKPDVEEPQTETTSSSPSEEIPEEPSTPSEDSGNEELSGSDAASPSTPLLPSGSGSSAAATPSTPSTPKPPTVPAVSAVFDPAIMTDSGAANIPNYKKINADVKGWLKVPGTNVNYPVLHDAAPNHYYLDHDIYKAKSTNGVVYADPAVKFGVRDEISSNTVLYGHNWTNYSANPKIGDPNDVMFAQLAAYHHLNFAKAHPYIYYSTEGEEMTWQIFAAFYTDIGFYYNVANPKSKADFDYIINGAKARSRHIFDTPVSSSDKILTLSTCTRAYGKSDKQRFVIMAKLMPLGSDTKAVTVTANPKPILPKL